jgi:DNA (cytosine-5)-methyltransferase 1
MASRPIGIDIFAGAGGMSLGFEQAGFDIAAAIEVDPVHCAVHKFNFPNTAVIPRSVIGLSGAAVRLAAGIGDREIDCVFGGPPCQGFSMIGQRALDDSRNRLVLEFVRLVVELNPRTFVFENVKGLTVGRHKEFLVELVQAFEAGGYSVRQPWQVLNAAHYGVPQSRERLILFGVRAEENIPAYPAQQTRIAGRKSVRSDLKTGPTCYDAIGDLPDPERFSELIGHDHVVLSKRTKPSNYASEMLCLSNSDWHNGYVREWNPSRLTASARTDHSAISRQRFARTEPGSIEPISRFFKLPPVGVANTLRAGTDGARGAFTSPRPIHYKYARCISVREMARLHGFPDWFRFNVTKWHGARQIGNAVPPPLARAVAVSVVNSIGHQPSQPTDVVTLGDEALLKMDMSSASAHFNVDALSGRRDRKSGAKKRKQHEIEAGSASWPIAANG